MKREGIKRIPGQRKVAPRGATQKGGGERALPPGLKIWSLRVLWCSLLIAVVALGLHFGAEPLSEALNRPIETVKVEGEFRYASKGKVESLISSSLNEGFLQLDLEQVKVVLERDPWIERAAVQRQWPDVLRVRIFEQHPIARWGQDGFLNRNGDIIRVTEQDKLRDLPELGGEDDEAVEVMRQYQEIAELLRARGLTLRSLKSDLRKSWKMQLGQNIEVTIGRDSVMDKVGRFITVYDRRLQQRWQEVASVDLRYDSGIAVSWVKEQQE